LDKDVNIWFTSYSDQDTSIIKIETYKDFLKELRKFYGDLNKISTTEYKIERLTQTGSIDLYYSQFKEYMDILNWSENQKIYCFREELKMLDWMVGEESTRSYAVLLKQKQRGLTERN